MTHAGKVMGRWCSWRPPGAITAVMTCPGGLPFQDGFLMTLTGDLVISLGKMIRILTATVSTIFYHLTHAQRMSAKSLDLDLGFATLTV